MDRAVLTAYGWTDLPTACEFIPDYFEEDASGEPVPKSIRYRWPDAIRDEVLARLLKLNAERAEEERLLGEAAAEKPKKTKRKAEVATPQIELFPPMVPSPAGPSLTPWKERIAAFQFAIPNGKPTRPQVPLLYYRLLLPAVLQSAGGRLPWELFHTSVCLLADLDLLKANLAASVLARTKKWFTSFNAPIDPNAFGAAFDDAIQDAKTVRVVGEAPAFELRLAKAVGDPAAWIGLDAQMCLSAAVRIPTLQIPSVPDELRTKIIQFANVA